MFNAQNRTTDKSIKHFLIRKMLYKTSNGYSNDCKFQTTRLKAISKTKTSCSIFYVRFPIKAKYITNTIYRIFALLTQ